MDVITGEFMSLSSKIACIQMRFAEFERLTKARCEVIENYIGLIPVECKHEFMPDRTSDGHPYCTKCGKYAYDNTYKPVSNGTYTDKRNTYADKKDTYADDSIKFPAIGAIVKPSEILTALLCGPVGNVVVGSIEEKRMIKDAIQKVKEAGL